MSARLGCRDTPRVTAEWHLADSTPLHGAARVVVIADKDKPGRKHAEQEHESLVGHVREVGIVEAKVGKDAADHLAAGTGSTNSCR